VRPVNLIPPEERRGEKAPMRTGSLAYVVVAVLAVALLGVVGIVLTNNQISDRTSEKSSLQSQLSAAQAEATRTQSFADFASLRQAREQTVTSLAQSRFDWQRVLRELAIVIPHDVWLTSLNASVSPDAASGSAGSSSSSSSSTGSESVTGPSLHIEGCAAGHEAVARFLAALHDIDGVTRVSVLKSDRPDPTSSSGTATADSSGTAVGSDGCSSRDFVSTFEVVAAFDAVQIDATTQGIAPTTETTPTTQTTASTTDAGQSQVSDAGRQLQQQKDSAAQKTDQGRKAVDTFIPGAGSAP
jgi:Tfp pilus assembly protein PilN